MSPSRPTTGGVVWVEDAVLRAGFTQIPNVILSAPALSAGAKLAYIGLLSYAWQDGSCFPSQETLAERIGAGRRSVVRHLQELQDVGLLVITRRGQGMTNLYTLPRITPGVAANLKCQSGTSGPDAQQKCQSGTSGGAKPAQPEVPTRPAEEDAEEEDPQTWPSKLRKPARQKGSAQARPPAGSVPRSGAASPRTGTEQDVSGRPSETEPENGPAGGPPARRPRPARDERRRYDADRRLIVDYLSDFARELGDGAPLVSSVTRAANIKRLAGAEIGVFAEAMYHARAVTKERWAAIRKESRGPDDPFPRKRAMAYFFAELEHALGLRELPETPAEYAARKDAERRERERDRRHPDRARATGPRGWVQTYRPGEGLPAIGADGGADDAG